MTSPSYLTSSRFLPFGKPCLALIGILSLLFTSFVHGDLVGHWSLGQGSGDPIDGVTATVATLHNASWNWDPERSHSVEFSGNVGSYLNTNVTIPAGSLGTSGDFTWAFWAKRASDDTKQNALVIGNRYNPEGGEFSPRQFVKFTTTQFEWHMDGSANLAFPVAMPAGEWHHHAVVKQRDILAYYRDGEMLVSDLVNQALSEDLPLYFGGDPQADYPEEFFQGSLDDVRIYDEALDAEAIADVMRNTAPVVMNVVASQRPGTKLVDITFEVSDADSDEVSISVEISSDGGTSFVVPVTTLSGDTTVSATPTLESKTVVWDAGADLNQAYSEEMVVRVLADDGRAPGPPPSGMVLIPAGPFQMGDQSGSGARDELPVHTVIVSGFYLDQYEVSKALWDDVKVWGATNGYTDLPSGGGGGAFHPVHTVNWYDVVKWCNARSEKEGLTPVYHTDVGQSTVYRTGQMNLEASFVKWQANGYRLPTEAEWEKAARGRLEGNTYPWGNSIGGGDANYLTSGDPFDNGTTPVGYYDGDQEPPGENRANGYGLYDMAGNVWEWCWDVYADWYRQVGATEADTRGPNAATGSRVLRGGSWYNDTGVLRCALRVDYSPVFRSNVVGFRSARGH